ncbi:hypothetical protein GCM10007860_25730 [Chitiniphilus shinanonensis]|uniref:Uncharacterized protein n=1 Tax=Chitiniphilus shinanonensis TaxID=553088 RepID=A0ABQ6BW64_9NEIS|nr:hypothetical protein GCM10007860_25730 [Chitiniphilus shinanonensis]
MLDFVNIEANKASYGKLLTNQTGIRWARMGKCGKGASHAGDGLNDSEWAIRKRLECRH